jgi:hypothetical protein
MAKRDAPSGNETADVTPEFAVALSRAMGGEAGTHGFASMALARNGHAETEPRAERLTPMPGASPMPLASELPPASPVPPATPLPASQRPQVLRRSPMPR